MFTSSLAPKPRRLRLQFSLGLLLLAVTAFAIGFPIWYRWPYEESKPLYFGGSKTMPPMGRSVTTWRRKWGGGKVKSGKAMIETERPPRGIPRAKTVVHYQDDVRHGPFEDYSEGRLIREGQYDRGLREGKWVEYDTRSGKIICIAHWRQDRLDGPFEMRSYFGGKFDPFTAGGAGEPAGERHQKFQFAKGRLIGADGQPVSNRLLDQLESGAIDNPRIAQELQKVIPVGMEFVETPLKDALLYLQDAHNLPFMLDVRRVADIDRPITLNVKGLDLYSGLTLLTAQERLTFEYRYGVLFLTTVEHAQDRRDPTGVADIHPRGGTPLAAAWNEPCAIEAVEVPLEQVMQSLGQPLAIRFDLTALPPDGIPLSSPVTKNIKNLPLRHALGLLLDVLELRCEARGDDTLAILPQTSADRGRTPAGTEPRTRPKLTTPVPRSSPDPFSIPSSK